MRRLMLSLAAALALALTAVAATAVPGTTASQLTTRFKQATGEKLVVNKLQSYAGHYKAYDLGVQTIARKARWGTFTIYLVTGSAVETEVTDLLADSHTGALGTPASGGVYWEPGTTIHGEKFWMAKRRYGQNVVLSWTTTSSAKKVDLTFKRLHAALTKATK